MKIEKIKQNSGITLIALVVTIIVLIILATISINAVLGENGLIKKAEQAKEIQANAQAKEAEEMDELANAIAEQHVDPTANWDLSKVKKVTSEDNVIVPVPIGYTASTVTGEKSVSTGFVIKQGSDGSLTNGINEFVWVPVSNISDLYDSANNAGQLWDFSRTTSTKRAYPTTPNSDFREPDVVTKAYNSETGKYDIDAYDAISSNLEQAGLSSSATAADFKTQLQKEFKEMKDSVEKYGGFYIGRYETGNLSLSNGSKAVVQKYNTDIGDQTWYTQYKLSKTVAANSSVTTSMIWGCQWDATLRWMQTSSDEKVKNFATNSANYGNFKDNKITYKESVNGEAKTTTEGTATRIPTGGSETTNINNIYDMAGNVLDWTIESDLYNCRIRRGSNYENLGSDHPSSYRNGNSPTVSNSYFGSRLTLYVAL